MESVLLIYNAHPHFPPHKFGQKNVCFIHSKIWYFIKHFQETMQGPGLLTY